MRPSIVGPVRPLIRDLAAVFNDCFLILSDCAELVHVTKVR